MNEQALADQLQQAWDELHHALENNKHEDTIARLEGQVEELHAEQQEVARLIEQA